MRIDQSSDLEREVAILIAEQERTKALLEDNMAGLTVFSF